MISWLTSAESPWTDACGSRSPGAASGRYRESWRVRIHGPRYARGPRFPPERHPTNKQGVSSYYTADGNSMRKAFIRTPVDFARISSRFSSGRRHPILNKIRAHKGVDYAARAAHPSRLQVMAALQLAGRKGGYGNHCRDSTRQPLPHPVRPHERFCQRDPHRQHCAPGPDHWLYRHYRPVHRTAPAL